MVRKFWFYNFYHYAKVSIKGFVSFGFTTFITMQKFLLKGLYED